MLEGDFTTNFVISLVDAINAFEAFVVQGVFPNSCENYLDWKPKIDRVGLLFFIKVNAIYTKYAIFAKYGHILPHINNIVVELTLKTRQRLKQLMSINPMRT